MIKPAIVRISCIVAVAMFCLLTGCKQPDQEATSAEPEPYQGIIVAMGDSLTAGLGVSAAQSYPELLKKLLADSGLRYEVINSGVSGETSSGAKARVDWVMRLRPDIVILETGANDGLRGIDPELVEENIRSIIETLLDHDVVVVLAGMQMVTNLGPEYLSAFNRIYPRLASRYPVIFMPFFLKDVATVPELNQADGIHPTAEGYGVISGNLLPYVKKAIAAHSAASSEK